MILAIEIFVFKIENSRVVENISPQKIINVYENPIIFIKLIRRDILRKKYISENIVKPYIKCLHIRILGFLYNFVSYKNNSL